MAKLFGFSIEDGDKKLSKNILSPVPPNNEDGSEHYLATGFFGSYIDIEGVYRTEFDLIRRYREMSLHHEVDSAIEDIVNEAIVSDTNDSPVEIELSNLNASDGIKDAIRREFKTILEMLDFDRKSHEIFRNWYIDGRLYYHKLIDLKDPHAGIQDIRYVDSMKIRYVRQAKKPRGNGLGSKAFGEENAMDQVFPELNEYFVYNPKQTYPVGAADISMGAEKGIKFTKESIAYCTSGLVDRNKGTVLSWLNKAIKNLNQLRMIEDSVVIYRLSRSSEKRIFYIDVGNLPKPKAEQYLRETMMRYRNKMNYNSLTGEMDTSRKFMSLMEDFWLPRREGGRGTEVTTLPAGCLAMDTKVSLLDGRDLTISEIAAELDQGKQLWTYSCHPVTGEFAPGLVSWAGVTQKSAKVLKITLDNGETITCTYDHKFPIYDKGFVEAKDLEIGQSMIPLHRKKEKISKNSSDYEMIYDNNDKTWKFTHREVAKQCKDVYCKEFVYEDPSEPKQTIHHIDLNRYNNNPDNLCFMGHFDHFNYHSKEINKIKREFIESLKETHPDLYEEYHRRASEGSKKIWSSFTPEERAIQCSKIRDGIIEHFSNLTEEERAQKIEISINNLSGATEALQIKLQDQEFNEWFRTRIRDGWTVEMKEKAAIRGRLAAKLRFSNPEYAQEYRRQHQEKQKVVCSRLHLEFIKNLVLGKTTHEVKAIDVCEKLNSNEEMKNLFIELNKNKTIPNVPVENGFTVNIVRNLVKDFGYKNWHQFRMETKFYNHVITNIEYLNDEIEVGTLTIDSDEAIHNYHTFSLACGVYTKNSNLGELTDLDYFKRNLYKSLNVPETRIGGDSGFNLGRSTEILRDEVKFTKFVGRLRKRFSQLFVDLLRTQLLLKNIVTPEDWKRMAEHIQFDFLYDNHFAELKESELFTERLNMVSMSEPYVGRYFSQDYLRRKILRQTDEEIIEQDEIMAKEIEEGIIPDPNAPPVDPNTGVPLDPNAPPEAPGSAPGAPAAAPSTGNSINGQSGKVPVEPDIKPKEPKMPKGGEI
jgi:hypothetical protein